MRESRTYGFVRGVLGDQHPYRDSQPFWFEKSPPVVQRKAYVITTSGANSLETDRLR